jgi:hypothetical protein
MDVESCPCGRICLIFRLYIATPIALTEPLGRRDLLFLNRRAHFLDPNIVITLGINSSAFAKECFAIGSVYLYSMDWSSRRALPKLNRHPGLAVHIVLLNAMKDRLREKQQSCNTDQTS